MAPRSIGSYNYGYAASDPALTLSTVGVSTLDIYDIPNVTSSAWTHIASNSDSAIRDTSSTGDSNGFKIYPKNSVQSRIGFAATDKSLGNYAEGTIMPVGKAETLKIIAHRNKVLRDPNINLPVPARSDGTSESMNLTDCIKEAQARQSALGRIYWPAASYCYAYQPGVKDGETLSEKFHCHQWFLPAPGDALRFSWLARQASVEGSEFNIFANVISVGLVTSAPTWMLHSTGEYTDFNFSMVVSIANGLKIDSVDKNAVCGRISSYAVYPMVQF